MNKINYITFSSIPSPLASSLQIIKTCENLAKNNHEITLIKPATGLKKLSIMVAQTPKSTNLLKQVKKETL